ncbi:MAG: Putative membrane protein [Candidatus Midichloria mitochondrii]|uniref:Putative membrane protein n=1 Tax=Midichloria mitochondrii (strain IricVA) TaxID=696127 RepID=F7XUS5_MIDMI|nr:hypothetical protein [Candidatus Midichloria mitochondrii]AEI88424.1 putative membrane protein [Candidatus Midichloria mitochondrii IricVA]MDJ1256705.1 hypothetical protein [Candidatus Midichloria mitochondrii]MDJ1288597.1 hypothetical protein [Candidatus Midichloria mitochondrii]MDJ1299428.1 hypothetical protein [Candidatus Midichloria mitochondrii]MDJ1313382.1 hypothetical protein [Candidatus Midichloria mitochondrii]
MIKHEKNYSAEEVVPATENGFCETVKDVGLPTPLVLTLASFAAFIYIARKPEEFLSEAASISEGWKVLIYTVSATTLAGLTLLSLGSFLVNWFKSEDPSSKDQIFVDLKKEDINVEQLIPSYDKLQASKPVLEEPTLRATASFVYNNDSSAAESISRPSEPENESSTTRKYMQSFGHYLEEEFYPA